MPQEPLWYYLDGGKVLGPVSVPQLQQMAKAGTLVPQSQVCKEGTQDWIELSRLRLDFRGPVMPASAAPPEAAPARAAAPAHAALMNSGGSEHNLLHPAWVLDYRFEKFVTPKAVQLVWLLWLAGSALGLLIHFVLTAISLTRLSPGDWIFPVLSFGAAVFGALLSTLLLRVALEFLVNMFHMARQTPR